MPTRYCKRVAILPLIAFLLSVQTSSAAADDQAPDRWATVKSSYATIYVDKDIELRHVLKLIDVDFARYDPIEQALFIDKGYTEEKKLANKIDILVRKAKKILDMHPQDFHVTIRVYKSDDELRGAYESIFNEAKDHKAFYIHKFATIYISFANISESVLAHEIGHAVIDSYFNVLPPEKIRELLACYVDVHLKD